MFNKIVLYTALAGYIVPGISDRSSRARSLLQTYSTLSLIPLLLNQVLVLYVLIFQYEYVTDFFMSADIFCLYFYPTFITIYFLFLKNKFYSFLDRLDATVLAFSDNPLCKKKGRFLEPLNRFVTTWNKRTALYCITLSTTPILQGLVAYTKYWGLFGLARTDSLPYQLPFKPTGFPYYDATLLCMTLGMVLVCMKRSAFESFIFVIFLYVNFCFKQLGHVLKNLFRGGDYKDDSIYDVEKKLRLWIQTHQEIQR